MTLESIWPCFALLALLVAMASLPLFRFVDEAPGAATRLSPIDGLRGFLALGVFVFHLIVMHGFVQTGIWALPGTHFYALLGPVGVSVFFMLTGLLFWTKLLRSQGRPDWAALYVGRLFRIAPMYLLVVLAMLAVVCVRSGFELHEAPLVVAGEVLQWLALGWVDTQPAINGQVATHVLAGVTWTLWYEWAFYAGLIVLALFARRRVHLVFAVALLVLCLVAKMRWQVDALGFSALFAVGMVVASLLHLGLRPAWPQRALSTLALLCLAAPFVGSNGGYGSWTALALAAFFYLVCSGATLFGLLLGTAAQRLGRISYSLYLMQGLVLTGLFALAPVRRLAFVSPLAYWGVGAVCACALVAAAALGWTWVEKPGIALGRRLLLVRPRRPAPPITAQ